MDVFDYVIVGAGSAGCVLADRLSQAPDTSVCVLEAGPADRHPYIHLPAGFIKTFYNSSLNWCYSQEPGAWTGGRRIYAPRGKTLVGSSSMRPPTRCKARETPASPRPRPPPTLLETPGKKI